MSTSPSAPIAPAGSDEVMDRAILFADLAGYSAMMDRDELGTLEFIVGCSHLIDETSKRYGGDLVQTTGDGFLVLFEDAQGAVDFGVELHRLIAKRQTGTEHPAQFRIGIHLGRLHRVEGTIHGHAVNVAARLETEAQPGTCVVSRAVRDAVGTASGHQFEAVGSPPLKNIGERMALYRIPSPTGGGMTMLDAPVSIPVIGMLAVKSKDAAISFRANRKTSALLGYLAMSPGMRERHEKVASLLWPDLSEAAARRAFSNCRRRLAEILSDGFDDLLFSENGRIGLNELKFDTDLDVVMKDLRRGRVPAVLIDEPNWPRRILEGLDAVSPVFSAWRRVTCMTWRNRIQSALADVLNRDAPESDACRDAARAILAVEPGNEQASAALIRYHAGHDNRVAAFDEFSRLGSYLQTAYGLEPSAMVRAALAEARQGAIRLAATMPGEARAAPVIARFLRVAVDKFDDADEGESPLASRFRSELVANLARFREWSVVEGDGLLGEAGRAPGDPVHSVYDYAISGACRTSGKPSIWLQLRHLNSGRVVWSENLALDPAAWREVQRDVVGRIAAHLETYISADRLANVIGRSGHDATSHDAWLQAEQIFARWTPEAADEAEAMLRQIIERDEAFAPAYSSLASFRNVRHVVRPGLARDAESERSAHALAQRAVELDPLDARNHLAVAWTAALTGAFDRAAIHLDLAASLNPNNPSMLISCAMGHAFVGQAGRGEALVAHALRISPILSEYQWCYIASVHFLAGRYEEALKAARLSGDRIVDNEGWMAAALVRLGRIDEARAAVDKLIDMVRPVWAGADKPTAEAVFDWFVGAYPLRNAADRAVLAASLEAAMRGQ